MLIDFVVFFKVGFKVNYGGDDIFLLVIGGFFGVFGGGGFGLVVL